MPVDHKSECSREQALFSRRCSSIRCQNMFSIPIAARRGPAITLTGHWEHFTQPSQFLLFTDLRSQKSMRLPAERSSLVRLPTQSSGRLIGRGFRGGSSYSSIVEPTELAPPAFWPRGGFAEESLAS